MDDDKAWFGPKRYGYGASPRTWQGWAATIGFVVIEAVIVRLMAPRFNPVVTMIVALGAVAVFLLIVARTSRRDTWTWRWGGK